MSNNTRREFLTTVGVGVAVTTSKRKSLQASTSSVSDKLVVGVVGCGNRGTSLIRALAGFQDVAVGFVCDPDQARLTRAARMVSNTKPVTDFRRILEDKNVDAVLIATPDHWHAPAAILALDAGKHVYVEKPCSHNVREGQLLVEATRNSGLKVQHGTQQRSSAFTTKAVEKIEQGVIGDVLAARVWNVQKRGSIGRATPAEPPDGLNYDMWLGPAPYCPYQANRSHYDWHWWYAFGCGDFGNDGIHDFDYARWALGVEKPTLVSAIGGKYFFDDDQEFPDTQTVLFEYARNDEKKSKRQITYEMRLWTKNYPYNVDSGVEFYGTSGQLMVSKRGKIQLLNGQNQRQDFDLGVSQTDDLPKHLANWFDAIRLEAALNAPIEIAHHSALAVHLGNIATRLKKTIRFDPSAEKIVDDEDSGKLLGRQYRQDGHWAIPGRS